ncbi:hypothetical protein [Xanthovirga aplysinae]|uniref:hypothetical protein n=1 Tax=Xanthovirga aplysinae TaxID=2529853 RepID=UPI0012BD06A0|nr:hypothetical protein [Xanthovirga aplysinae]MTI32831.1 hypothetical protein [Xanthovirga aplysinae]
MRNVVNLAMVLLLTIFLNSCATVFGGRITESQRRKPMPGEPQRQIRVGAFIADLLIFWPSLIVDFGTGAIYRPNYHQSNYYHIHVEPSSD